MFQKDSYKWSMTPLVLLVLMFLTGAAAAGDIDEQVGQRHFETIDLDDLVTIADDSNEPITFPKIDRHPDPATWCAYRGSLTSIPTYDLNDPNAFQVDLRSYDLSALDLSPSFDKLIYADFDSQTTWPPEWMPPQFDWAQIMELGRNPGLGVRDLHARGITGHNVGIAISDKPLLTEHQEYADRLRLYEEINIDPGTIAQMHGAAVASIAVGQTLGVAPGADLYYIAAPNGYLLDPADPNSFVYDWQYKAQAIRRILQINEQLPQNRKIRVISISVAWSPEQIGYDDIMAACEEAKAAGMLIVSSSIERVHGLKFHGLGRHPFADPDAFELREPGLFYLIRFYSGVYRFSDRLLVPMDSRTTASPCAADEFAFYRNGGWSWAIPWIAGLYALAAQANPAVTPEQFWSQAMGTGRTIEITYNDETIPLGPIADPFALMGSLIPPPINEFDDVHNDDLSQLDLWYWPDLIATLTFNQNTIWPEPNKMPPGCDPNQIMTDAINPGLGVRALHQQGITGAGVNVAIIDQPLIQSHPEYAGKIAAYHDVGCGGAVSSMHGPAVASLLVGTNCGTAPDARLYHVAVPSWDKDAADCAEALDWIIAQNETLDPSEKIRLVSVSAQPSGLGSPFDYNQPMWDVAVANAQAAGILVLDCTWHHGIVSLCWYDANDPENVAKCTPGFRDGPVEVDTGHIHAPTAPRTTAEVGSEGAFSYIYWGGTHRSSVPYSKAGYSWAIPYCAGVLAMGWQIRPELTGDQMVDLLFQTAYIDSHGAQIINPQQFISLLDANSPAIQLSAQEISFYAVPAVLPESQILSISNGGLSTLNWVINETCDWLQVNPTNGSSTGTDDINEVTLRIIELPPGTHTCQLAISDPCAINDPQTVTVNLYVYTDDDGELHVPAEYPTIQAAIDDCNDGDTVIIAPAVYTGPGNRDLDFKGKAITVRSMQPENPHVVAETVVDCQATLLQKHRAFSFHNSEDANSVLNGITITNGLHEGAAISCQGSSPTLANCIFTGNMGDRHGGGVFCSYSSPTLINCTFGNNSAKDHGGGMANYPHSNPTVINCIFTGNSAINGGGMVNYNSDPILINCTFSGNSASNGGAIYIGNMSNPTMTNCILWADAPQEIYIFSGTPVVTYCNVQAGFPGMNNIDADPYFVDAANADYHLKSQAGRWDPNLTTWVTDVLTSPSVDAGDPGSDWTAELWPHGKHINMGAYGGTPQASMSPSSVGNIADLNHDNVVNYIDLMLFDEQWVRYMLLLPEDFDRNGIVNLADFAIIADNWLQTGSP